MDERLLHSVRRALPFLQQAGLVDFWPYGLLQDVHNPALPDEQREQLRYVRRIMPLVHERLKRLDEVSELTRFFFAEELEYDAALLIGKGMTAEKSRAALEAVRPAVEAIDEFEVPALEEAVRPLAESLGLSTGQLFGTIRVAVTGRTVAPPLFETMAVLGRSRCLRRLDVAIVRLTGL